MAVETVSELMELFNRHPFLEPIQQLELPKLQEQYPDARGLLNELLRRNWLTAYQVQQLTLGRGEELMLDRYLILDLLGEGKLGELYKAKNCKLKRAVSLKVLGADVLENTAAVERFYQEVQAASQVSHPFIVQAYDAGPLGDTHFFAMEYVDGIDLQRHVKQSGPVPIHQACIFIRQAAIALQHAFERSLLHNDLKPSNLVLSEKTEEGPGMPKTGRSGQFTLAGAMPGQIIRVRNLGLSLIRQHTRHTRLASASDVGEDETADYRAPEQTARKPKDVRSEIYSLGCIFYFLLTGVPPYPGGSAADKAKRHQSSEPTPVEELRPECPKEVGDIVRKLMAHKPEDRYQTPAEADAALAQLQIHTQNAHRTKTARSTRRVLALACGLGTLLVLTLVGTFMVLLLSGQKVATSVVQSPSSTEQVPPTTEQTPTTENKTTTPAADPATVFLSSLQELDVKVDPNHPFGKSGDLGYGTGRIIVKGKPVLQGISMHPPKDGASQVSWNLDKKWKKLAGQVAVDDSARGSLKKPLTLKALGDGKPLGKPVDLKNIKKQEPFEVDVTGISKLTLEIQCVGPNGSALVVLVDPKLTK